MRYNSVKTAIFKNRPNRFIAHVLLDGSMETVHVKNTGRCKEILKEDAICFLEEAANTGRKTRYSLISCYKGSTLINIDSQIPNAVVYESIFQGKIEEFKEVKQLKREVAYSSSRFDIYFNTGLHEGFIEVKGVTLEKDGIAMFPDAPTQRGTKHVYEMIKAVREGYLGYIFFLIQMKGANSFIPNQETDPDFSQALKTASENGVRILAYDSIVSDNEIIIGSPVKIKL